MKKARIVDVLVDRGLCADVCVAQRWIMAGLVIVDEVRVDKPGTKIPVDAQIRVKGRSRRYVSRGGTKLESALQAFNVEVVGKVALDAGASTGGFTDCLLAHDAARVYAVDVGFGQLHGRLRAHDKVVVLERTNLGDQRLRELRPRPQLITLDLSYLSLVDALPIARTLIADDGDILCLFKPLFEVADNQIKRTGGDPCDDQICEAMQLLVKRSTECELILRGVVPSPILGSRGTREFLMHFHLGDARGQCSATQVATMIYLGGCKKNGDVASRHAE